MDNRERAIRFRTARTDLNRNGSETMQAVSRATGVGASTICDLENPDSRRAPSAKNVNLLAEHYGGNAAWLTGQSDSPSLREDIRAATDMTGLSEKAISILRDLTADDDTRTFVNEFIESAEFSRMIRMIRALRQPKVSEDFSWDPAGPVDYTKVMQTYYGDSDETSMAEGSAGDLYEWLIGRDMNDIVRKLSGR